MDYALDKTRNEEVKASQARPSGSLRYVCPLCRKPVMLRGGFIRRRHFAHRPGEGTLECENYHPGTGQGGAGRPEGPRKQHPLNLYFHLLEPIGGLKRWQLEIVLPHSPSPIGFVRVEQATVYCVILFKKSIRVRVTPASTNYSVTASASTEESYATRVGLPVPGLDVDVGNVFRYSETSGRRLEPSQPLYWGRGYFLVWRDEARLIWPPTIWHERLADTGLWKAAMFELPPEEDVSTAAWAGQYLARPILRPPALLSLVSPVGYRDPETEEHVVDGHLPLYLGVVRPHGARAPSKLRIENSRDVPREIQIPNNEYVAVELGKVSSGILRAIADDDDDEMLSVIVASTVRDYAAGPATLTFHGPADSGVTLPIHSAGMQAMFDEVASGKLQLSGVEIPFGVSATLVLHDETDRFRKFSLPSDLEPEQEDAATTGLQSQILRALSGAVTLGQAFTFDIGNFGCVTFRPPRAKAAIGSLQLSRALRGRLTWLWTVSAGHEGSAERLVPWPIQIKDLSQSRALLPTDRSLLRDLAMLPGFPARVEAHVRAIMRSLARPRNAQ